jgi:hypothetical protein
MAKKDLVRLLVRLFGDPAHLDKVKKNPAKALAAAGLSPAERDLVMSRNDAKIRAYLGSEGAKANIKSKTGLANIKSKTGTANIKTKTTTGAIKAKTSAIKAKTVAIKAKTAAIKAIAKSESDAGVATTAAIKAKTKK